MTANIANVTNLSAPQSAPMAVPARNVTPWRGVRPTTMDEALRMSKAIAVTSFAPASYTRGKRLDDENDLKSVTASIFAAIQMGAEVGLSPMASLQNIAVINGKPGLYGPAMLAVVEASGLLADIDEGVRGEGTAMEAYCTVQRVGRKPRTFTFTHAQAKRAGLIGKAGPWTQYPERMFLARARTFALRDIFPDVLAGLSQSVEELMDIPANDVPAPPYYPHVQIAPADAPLPNVTEPEAPITEEYITEFETDVQKMLKSIETLDALDDLWLGSGRIKAEVVKIGKKDKEARDRIVAAFTQKHAELSERLEADAEAGETPDDAQGNDAPDHADRAQPAHAAPDDAITTATKAMQADEPAKQKAALSPPTAINVMRGDDGKPNWKAFGEEVCAQVKLAAKNDCDDEWLTESRKANNPNINKLRAVSKVAADYIDSLYTEKLNRALALRDEAKAEAERKFPSIPVPYDGNEPNWIGFADLLKGYLDSTENYRVAAIWWPKHDMQMKNMREADPQSAAHFEEALYGKFPQLGVDRNAK